MFAYFDGTVGGARRELTAVAGYLFDRDGAARFERLYRDTVEPRLPPDKHGVRVFHAAPCFDGDGLFFGMQRPIRESILALMADAIKQTATVGITVGIEDDEFNRGLEGHYVGVNVRGVKASSLAPWVGSKYSVCLLRCVHGLNSWLNGQSIEGPIEYVMEAGERPEIEEETIGIFSRLAQHPKLRRQYRIGKYGFMPKGPETPWLFAADYFAWVWQHNDLVSNAPLRDEYGDWQTPVVPLIEAKPHLASYLTEQSVNIQALVNAANRLFTPDVGDV